MTIYDRNPNDLAWGDIRGERPWGHPADTTFDTLALRRCEWELSEQDRYCFECPLPECDQADPRCPFAYVNSEKKAKRDRTLEKRIYRLRNKWERELDEAVERILAEREAPCAPASQRPPGEWVWCSALSRQLWTQRQAECP